MSVVDRRRTGPPVVVAEFRLLFEPTNVSYSWQRVAPSIGPIVAGTEDLLWNPPESTYKPITLALPSTAKPGESWRVGLHIGPHKAVDVTHYTSVKPAIIGVWSEGISLVRGESSTSGQVRTVGGSKGPKAKADEGRNKGKAGKGKDDEGKKQGRINREWMAGDGALRVVEQTSFDLDKVSLGRSRADCRKYGTRVWACQGGYGGIWTKPIAT